MRDVLFYLAGLFTLPLLLVILSVIMGTIAKAAEDEL